MRTTSGILLALAMAAAVSCTRGRFTKTDSYPEIFPDYIGVTIPENMAEPRFGMADGSRCKVECRRDADTLWYKVSAWRKGERGGTEYREFPIYISHEAIDPHIVYRLIEPGYESWHDMGIYQRELESYREKAIVTNKVNDRGCINCHNFPSGDPNHMIFHARGKGGGTIFIKNGKAEKVNLAEVGPKVQGTYPAWNPDGRHVVFSSNATNQSFFIAAHQPLEVYDQASDMILMDLETGQVSVVAQTEGLLETFPTWSDDGKTLYYCAGVKPEKLPDNREQLHYALMALDFNGKNFDGEARTVFESDSLSVSFPRVKGDKIVFTASSYGTFPIWHKEADLWMLDLSDSSLRRLDELNSDDTESYHSWSSNGKWMVFSSRRTDGRYTRLFITHYNGDGSFTKPFLLPQKSADFDQLRLKSYNIPEFVKGEVPEMETEIRRLF